MKKYFFQSPKSKAIYDAMPHDVRTRLDINLESLEKKADNNPAIAKMLAPEVIPDFSDIPIDVNLSLDEIVEHFRILSILSCQTDRPRGK